MKQSKDKVLFTQNDSITNNINEYDTIDMLITDINLSKVLRRLPIQW